MIEAAEVYAVLKENPEFSDAEASQLMLQCQAGVDKVKRNLKDGVNEDDPLIGKTAAAMARYYFFLSCVGGTQKYSSYKVGDLTVQRDFEKEFELENRLMQQAIADAAEILKDGGFYFELC